MNHRNTGTESDQQARNISRCVRDIEAVDFFNVLTGPELLEMTDSYLPEHRERLYPPTRQTPFLKEADAKYTL